MNLEEILETWIGNLEFNIGQVEKSLPSANTHYNPDQAKQQYWETKGMLKAYQKVYDLI